MTRPARHWARGRPVRQRSRRVVCATPDCRNNRPRLTLRCGWFSRKQGRRPTTLMIESRRLSSRSRAWDAITSGVGYHLDNLGRWLIGHAPQFGSAYAALLAPGVPKLCCRPGWRFGEEYYDRRLWLACRRGALWEEAAKNNLVLPLTLPWHDGTMVDVTLGNDNSLCLYVCGSFEPNEFAFVDRFLKPGMVFIDVGANEGYYTLFAARRVGPKGLVIAVEPSSRERASLQRNLDRNRLGNVRVVSSALGARSGVADLRLAQEIHSGHNTLGTFANEGVIAVNEERVKMETLDAVATDFGLEQIDFVKIDVEGAEGSVVAGARQILGRTRPLMLLEIHDSALRAQGNSAESLLADLRGGLDYEILVFSASTGLVERLVDGASLSANVVAAPRERVAELVGPA